MGKEEELVMVLFPSEMPLFLGPLGKGTVLPLLRSRFWRSADGRISTLSGCWPIGGGTHDCKDKRQPVK